MLSCLGASVHRRGMVLAGNCAGHTYITHTCVCTHQHFPYIPSPSSTLYPLDVCPWFRPSHASVHTCFAVGLLCLPTYCRPHLSAGRCTCWSFPPASLIVPGFIPSCQIAQDTTAEFFDGGSSFGLKDIVTVKNEKRILSFYHTARLDGLVRREELEG